MFITIQNKHENHKRQQIRPMHNHIKRAICPCGLTGFKKGLFNPLQDIKIKKLGRFRPCNKEQHHKQKLPFPMYSFITNLRQQPGPRQFPGLKQQLQLVTRRCR